MVIGQTGQVRSDLRHGVGVALAALLWLVAGLYTAWLTHDLLAPRSACESSIPWFEGLKLEHAEVEWLPPSVHCSLVDTDSDQLGERSSHVLWEQGDLTYVVVLDVLAVAETTRRLARRRRRRATAATATESPAAVQ